ncbi:MAG: hypothetical protein AAGA19_17035 [Pseudomonadota bacterium]
MGFAAAVESYAYFFTRADIGAPIVFAVVTAILWIPVAIFMLFLPPPYNLGQPLLLAVFWVKSILAAALAGLLVWLVVFALGRALRLERGGVILLAAVPALFGGVYIGLTYTAGIAPLDALADVRVEEARLAAVLSIVVGPLVAVMGLSGT